MTSEKLRDLNDPARVLRPFSAEGKVHDAHKKRPPILPKSRHSAVPEIDPTLGVPKKRLGRHANLICPEGWVENNLKPNWFETLDQGSALFDIEAKTMLCREFVEKNRNQLWKYDLKYLNRTPRGVADELFDHPNFVKKFQTYHDKERKMVLSNSNQMKAVLRDDEYNSLGEISSSQDPFLQGFNTSRNERSNKMINLLSTACSINGGASVCRRGYKHAPEYGNFSTFNGLLQANKGALLNR